VRYPGKPGPGPAVVALGERAWSRKQQRDVGSGDVGEAKSWLGLSDPGRGRPIVRGLIAARLLLAHTSR
jgi:hypothetical protein